MSIASTTNRVDYTGNDSAFKFGYTFRIFSKQDLKLTRLNVLSGVETPLELDSDYTVTGVGEEAGGEISLTAGALPSLHRLSIRRVVPLTQETDIRNQGEIFPEVLEDTYDHGVMIAQQQQDELDRALKLPETISGSSFNGQLPATIAGSQSLTLITNSTGDGLDLGPSLSTINQAISAEGAALASAVEASNSVITASRWALETTSTVIDAQTDVDSGDYSAKEYAIGTQNQGLSGGGSARDWATLTTGTVDDTEFSSKEYAMGTQNQGISGGGSAKDWATLTTGTVDDVEFSAKYYALDAKVSADIATATQPTYDAIVGVGGSHADLSALMADVNIANLKNILVISPQTLLTTVILNQNDFRVDFKPLAFINKDPGGSATVGLQITAQRVKLTNCRFTHFNAPGDKAVSLSAASKYCVVWGCYFLDCTSSIEDLGTANAQSANFDEV